MQDIKMSRKDRGMSCVGDGLEGQPVAALDGITGGINPHLDSPSKQVKIGSLLRLFQRSRGPHIMTCQQLPISVFLPISSIDIPSIVYESATVRKDAKAGYFPPPFKLHFISGNISRCDGCKGKYSKPALPPNNLSV